MAGIVPGPRVAELARYRLEVGAVPTVEAEDLVFGGLVAVTVGATDAATRWYAVAETGLVGAPPAHRAGGGAVPEEPLAEVAGARNGELAGIDSGRRRLRDGDGRRAVATLAASLDGEGSRVGGHAIDAESAMTLTYAPDTGLPSASRTVPTTRALSPIDAVTATWRRTSGLSLA